MTTFWNRVGALLHAEDGELLSIEGFALLTVTLLWFLMVAGSLRRFTRLGLLNLCLFGAYTAAPNLISNALGRMHNISDVSRDRFSVYLIIWATYLLIAHASADNINALSLDDNENHKRYTVQFLILASLFAWAVVIRTGLFREPGILWAFILLWFSIYLKVQERQSALVYASKPGVGLTTRIFADYMRYTSYYINITPIVFNEKAPSGLALTNLRWPNLAETGVRRQRHLLIQKTKHPPEHQPQHFLSPLPPYWWRQ